MNTLKESRFISSRSHYLVLLFAIAVLLMPGLAGAQTFTDDFDDTTTYLLPVNPNTKWRQIGIASGTFSAEIGSDGTGFSVRMVDTNPEFSMPVLAADNAQYYDLSSAAIECEVRPNPDLLGDYIGSGGVAFGVYDETGEDSYGGIGATVVLEGLQWAFVIFDAAKYESEPYLIGAMWVDIDPDVFHHIRLESLDGQITGTLDGTWTLTGPQRLPIDVAAGAVWANEFGDYSFDNFSMTGQPDNRHTVFQDVDLVTTELGADEVFPSWSRDGKKLAYLRRDFSAMGVWNVYVQSIDPPGAPIQCTQSEDNVWIYSIPAFSPDFTYVIFTARNAEGGVSIKRARADGTGEVETLLSQSETNYELFDVSADSSLLIGTIEPWGGMANIFAVEVAADGSIAPEAEVKLLTNFNSGEWGAWGSHLDYTGDRIAFTSMEYSDPPRNADIYVLSGVQAILADPTTAPTEYATDPRLVHIAGGPGFQGTPRFSRDGSLVYYCEDINAVFDVAQMEQDAYLPWLDMMQGSHWEIFAADADGVEDTIKLNYYRPYNQGVLDASPDGTKLVFVSDKLDDGDTDEDSDLYIVTLLVQEAIDASTGGQIVDGSGTTMDLPADSISEDTVISIKTPLPGDTPSPETLPGGLQNIALARVIDAESETATINPDNPPILTIHYTDEEIAGLDELSLRIYVYNEDTLSWEAIGNCLDDPMQDCTVIDPVENTISAPLPHLSTFCVSGALAGTLPVVGSFMPPLTTEEDFSLQYGTTLPVKFDVRDPAGAFLPNEPVGAVVTDSSSSRIAEFVRGDGSENIRVDEASEQYIFNLHSKDYGLLEDAVYKIVILWNNIPVGEIEFTVDYTKGTGRGRNK